MGYIDDDEQAWANVVEALRGYLQIQVEHSRRPAPIQMIATAIADDVRFVMLDDLLPEAMQDARGMLYTGDNQPEGSMT